MLAPKDMATALVEFVKSDPAYKADVVDEVIDELIGTEQTALVKNIRGIPAEMVELISDGLSDAIKEAIKKKFQP